MSKDTQWLGGRPGRQVTVTPTEALEELRSAVRIANSLTEDGYKRIKLSLAMAWVEWKLSSHDVN